jgi:hypothetical protein
LSKKKYKKGNRLCAQTRLGQAPPPRYRRSRAITKRYKEQHKDVHIAKLRLKSPLKNSYEALEEPIFEK